MALQLKRAGFRNVRPLAGGLDEWVRLGLPTEEVPRPEGEPGALVSSSAASADENKVL